MTKVTELIRPEQAAAWTTTDTIFITAGTGGGKSYFIKNTLYDVAKNLDKKILFLIHRINCVNQFEYEIVNSQKTDVIDIRTYQHLEHGAKTNLSAYDYIVCDESHYFFSDALFSNTTDISLNKILKQEHATKIFMSACGDYTKGYLKHIKKIDVKEYDIPVSYDFISELIFYNSDKSLDEIVKKIIKSKKKAILFINKLEEAYALYSKYKEYAMFNCSKHNKYFKHVNVEKLNKMLEDQKFDDQILITTTCLDSGVNLIDLDLKYVLCDIQDTGTLIQAIGRKRIQDESDKLTLYIKAIGNESLGGRIRKLQHELEKATYLKENDYKKYLEKYYKQSDSSGLTFSESVEGNDDMATLQINDQKFYKYRLDIKEAKRMVQKGKKYGYCTFIQTLLKQYDYTVMEEKTNKEKLIGYLDRNVGTKFYKDKRKELIKRLAIKDSRGRIQKTTELFNAYFAENNLLYCIKAHIDNTRRLDNGYDNPNFRKRYWMIYSLSDSVCTENVDIP